MATQTSQPFNVKEETTAIYGTTVQDEDGNGIAASSLDAMTLTLYRRGYPTAFINSRNAQDVLNDNNVTVSAAGVLEWTIQPADNEIQGSPATGGTEEHIALFQWTYLTTKKGKHEVRILVKNLATVT